MTIQLKPEHEQLIGQAIRAGLIETAAEVVELGVETIRQRLEARNATDAPPADEWMRKFRAWAHSHRTDTPLLSEQAIGRESIYRDRGL
jgi:hypothetical protein